MDFKMKRLMIFLLLGIFMLSLVSALEKVGYDWDNIEEFTINENTSIYGKYEIRNSVLGIPFLQLSNVIDIELLNNTDNCLIECTATPDFVLYNDGILVDEVSFRTLQSDGSWLEQPIRSYSLSYLDVIQDYKSVCTDTELLGNGTQLQSCVKQKSGTHIGKINYKLGDVVPAGNYTLTLYGNKKSTRIIDWRIKSNGIWTDEWTTWGNISLGADSQVTLNSPANDSTSFVSLVTFNATAEVGAGALLLNMSLYTNETGTWASRISKIVATIGLVSYYTLDQTTGNALDFLNVNDLTESGTVPSQVGIINNSRGVYSGSNFFSDTSFSNAINGSQDFSISLWVNRTGSIASNQRFLKLDDGTANELLFNLDFDSNNLVRMVMGKNGVGATVIVTSDDIELNEWTQIVATFNSSNNQMRLYVNGTLDKTDTFTDTAVLFSDSFFLGATSGGGNPFTNGFIDEVGYWNKTLDATEISDIYNSGAGERPFTNLSTQTFDRLINDAIIWNVEACDSDGDCGFAVQNFTLNVELEPPLISIETPNGLEGFGGVGINQTLNVTFTDVNLDTCWFDYNGTNVTINGCLTGVKNSTNFILEQDNFNMTVYANDTIGRENSSFTSWSYKVFEINQTFNPNTTEGDTESFEADINLLNGLSVSIALLVYNGTATVGSASTVGNITTLSAEGIIVPGVTSDVNLTFFWALLLSDSTAINMSTKTQEVFSLGIDNCSTFTNVIINFTNVDEEFQTLLPNSTIETAINIFSQDRSVTVLNISGSFTTNPTAICLNNPLTNQTNYIMDVIVKYSAQDHAIEYFNLVDFALNLQTSNQNLTLFDLNLSDSTEFQLTFKGADFIPIENVLVFTERQYIAENVFKTVELPKTDSNGQTVLHLVRDDIIYNLIFVKDGVTLGTFKNIIAFCQDFTIGECILDLAAISDVSAFETYGEFIGITFNSPPIFNSATNLVTFAFTSDDGTAKVVSMSVERRDIFGNQTVCTNSVASSSGTLFCNIGQNLTETVLFTIISIDSDEIIFNTVVISEGNYGDIGFAMWFILTLTLILMASDSKNGVILVTLLSYLGALSMGLFVGGAVGLGSSGIWVLVITTAAFWQLNRKRGV